MFGTDDKTSLPTISFGYTGFDPAAQQVAAITNPPAFSLADPNTELADFDGDGTPDLVHAALGRHEVAINQGGRFAAAVPIPSNPSVQLSANGTELADFDGDGIVDLLSKLSPGTGDFVFFPNRGRGDWEPASRFRNNPAFSFEDPGVRLIDFDGDGLVDVMQTTPTQYYYWRNNGDGSWARASRQRADRRSAGRLLGFARPPRRHERRSPDRPGLRPGRRDHLLAEPGLGTLGRRGLRRGRARRGRRSGARAARRHERRRPHRRVAGGGHRAAHLAAAGRRPLRRADRVQRPARREPARRRSCASRT